MIRQHDDRLHLARPGSSAVVTRRGSSRDGDSPELTGRRVDALLRAGVDERQPEARPSPIEGILLGVVAGIALWSLVAGAALLTWLG